MQLRFGRLLVAAIVIEVLAVLMLIALFAAFGPSEQAAAQAFAERWVGPLGGFVLCLAGGFWVARSVATTHVLNGMVLGLTVVGIDNGYFQALGAPAGDIFTISNVGRVIAGTIGGWLASRRFKHELDPSGRPMKTIHTPERARTKHRLALVLYSISLLLPAAFIDGITLWGWQAALLTILDHPANPRGLLAALLVSPSNIGLWVAAVLIPGRAPRGACAASFAAFVSMLYCGLRGAPDGHLGPGYYLWLTSGLLMLLAAWQAYPTALRDRASKILGRPGQFHDQAVTINAQIAEGMRVKHSGAPSPAPPSTNDV